MNKNEKTVAPFLGKMEQREIFIYSLNQNLLNILVHTEFN